MLSQMTKSKVVSLKPSKTGMPDAVLITVCASPETVEQLTSSIKRRNWGVNVSHYSSYFSAVKRPYFTPLIQSSEAAVAFVDFDTSPKEAAETAKYLTHMFAGKITLIALANGHDSSRLLTAMRSGCNEFLETPLVESELNDILDRVELHWLYSNVHETHTGSVISFFGVKGGVGTTTLAVHLGIFLAQNHKKKVLLIDHHPELGHVCINLGIDGAHCHFQEVVRNVGRLDSQLLQGLVCVHASGLNVLSSPDICGGRRALDNDAMSKTLDFLRSEYDYVIVDCDISFEDHNYPVITASQRIYVVATPEVSALRDLSRHVDHIGLLDSSMEKVQIVVNRVSESDAIQVEQIEKAIKLPVVIRIPSGKKEFVRAANLGEPILPGNRSAFGEKFSKWAELVAGSKAGDAQAEKKPKSLLSLWK
jgi:pilus assembly protein CpaE